MYINVNYDIFMRKYANREKMKITNNPEKNNDSQ